MELITISGYAYPAIQDWVLESWLPDLTFLGNFSYGITTEGGIIDLADEKLTESCPAGRGASYDGSYAA